MKKVDVLLLLAIAALLMLFSFSPEFASIYNQINHNYGLWMSFVKFAVLATLGESLAMRIRTGEYNSQGFGLWPKAIVWGFIGLTIKMAFVIFSTGTAAFVEYLGLEDTRASLDGPLTAKALLVALTISTTMNVIYAPIMMTFHRITDTHIARHGGKLIALVKPIPFANILQSLDWDNLWHFVFKKTIPLFWIPAHTITFLLPEQHQVLFAAMLSVALGILLSLAAQNKPVSGGAV